ncbi:MAG TPA: shikimate kinase [Bacteroidetes bacterium]|nr:shikimate kinase [Bacteroidota bacterium]
MKIFLIGFMGSGKSMFGKEFALSAGLFFADLDEIIEINEGKNISNIFAKEGEEVFRVLEHKALLQAINTMDDVVIAVGGGTPCFFDHMKLMNQVGQTIYLKYPPEKLFEYLKEEPDKRPLISGKSDEELIDYIRKKLKEREFFYEQAQHILSWPEISVEALKKIISQ